MPRSREFSGKRTGTGELNSFGSGIAPEEERVARAGRVDQVVCHQTGDRGGSYRVLFEQRFEQRGKNPRFSGARRFCGIESVGLVAEQIDESARAPMGSTTAGETEGSAGRRCTEEVPPGRRHAGCGDQVLLQLQSIQAYLN